MLSRPGAFALSTTVLLGSALASGETTTITVKALRTAPADYANKAVTVVGRFRGRPAPRGQRADIAPLDRSRWDFLLELDDAAVWISGIRPAGWDFDLDPRSSTDSIRGPWLQVTGMVRLQTGRSHRCASCSQLWIEASDLRPAPPPTGEPTPLLRPALAAPAVVFRDPIEGEADVPPDAPVRLQFSRPIVPETLSERVRISYTSPLTVAGAPIPTFTARYSAATRSLTIVFSEPLAARQTVKVELLEGITAVNGLALPPSAYTFSTLR